MGLDDEELAREEDGEIDPANLSYAGGGGPSCRR